MDDLPVEVNGDHVGRRSAHRADDSGRNDGAGLIVEGGDEIANADGLYRPAVDHRPGRKAFINDE